MFPDHHAFCRQKNGSFVTPARHVVKRGAYHLNYLLRLEAHMLVWRLRSSARLDDHRLRNHWYKARLHEPILTKSEIPNIPIATISEGVTFGWLFTGCQENDQRSKPIATG